LPVVTHQFYLHSKVGLQFGLNAPVNSKHILYNSSLKFISNTSL